MSDKKIEPEDFKLLYKETVEGKVAKNLEKVAEIGAGLITDMLKRPGISAPPAQKAFFKADYYTCNDEGGVLNHTCWTEAIEEHVDGWHDPQPPPNRPIDEIIADIAPLKVFGWTRKVLPTSFGFGEGAIDTLLEDFEEMYWCDEYGNAFEEGSPPWDEEVLKVVKAKLYATMEECVQLAHIWQCEQNCQMEFDVEELTTILKDQCPHWWDKK